MAHDYRTRAKALVIATIIFAAISIILFLLAKWKTIDTDSTIDTAVFSDYGQFVGGLASVALTIASVYLIVQTINESRISNVKQKVESRFFDLLKIHIENRNNVLRSKNNAFEEFLNELGVLIWAMEGLPFNFDVPPRKRRGIAYSFFFYGVYLEKFPGNYTYQQVTHILRKEFPQNLELSADTFINAFQYQLKQKNLSIETLKGHQDILGHYYQHMFQTVNYINEQPASLFSYDEKYEYIKTLRVQLSVSEQLLLYYNSLSELGKKWELQENLEDNRKLITKYNLIKNIPVDLLLYPESDIRPTYPDVYYERDTGQTERRTDLEKIYNNY